MKRVLVLGGTGEALAIVRDLTRIPDIEVIYSLAGRTRTPSLPDFPNCLVREGGFGGASGLRRFIVENDIAALADATHPYAAQMAENARGAAAAGGIPLFKYLRPGWKEDTGTPWLHAATPADAARIIVGRFDRVFLSSGLGDIGAFSPLSDIWFLVRSVDQPVTPVALAKHRHITARGPFDIESETALLREHRIKALVSKNSGGNATIAKLHAASALGIPVVMIDRPVLPATPYFEDMAGLLEAIRRNLAAAC